jgi:adenylate cyclase class 2
MKDRKGGAQENEIKLALSGAAAGRRILRAAGFRVIHPRVFESNIVLDTPDHSILHAGALLRVRQVGKRGILTYKGPAAEDGPHKSRLEVESEISDPAATQAIFGKLGFHPVFRYDKYRTEFARQGESGKAMLDETPIGVYLELEGAPRWVDRTARLLGFAPADYIKSSYGRLYAEHCAAHGRERDDMVFPARRA